MKITKNKKASIIFPPLLVIIALIVLVFALIAIKNKTDKIKNIAIGERQIEIFGTYQEGENILFYLDQAGKYSAETSAEDLADSGGYFGSSECGSDSSVVLWENNGKDCSPDKDTLLRSYESFFNQEISKYSYTSENSISFPNSYSVSSSKDGIIMRSNDFLIIGKYSENSKQTSTTGPFSGKTVVLDTCEFAGIDADGNFNKNIGERTATKSDPSFSSSEIVSYKGFQMHKELKECAEKLDKISGGKLIITSAYRPGSTRSFHSLGQALDFIIIGKNYQETALIAQEAGCFSWVYNEEIPCNNHGDGLHVHGSVSVNE